MHAACEVIAEVGVGNVTHRLVATRAGVPLGATTYYFSSLDDLVTAALEHVSAQTMALLREWMDRARDTDDLAAVLTALTGEYLADRGRARVEYELYVAAARTPVLRPWARAWVDGLTDFLSAQVPREAATAAVALLDGVMLQAVTLDVPLDHGWLHRALDRCLA